MRRNRDYFGDEFYNSGEDGGEENVNNQV